MRFRIRPLVVGMAVGFVVGLTAGICDRAYLSADAPVPETDHPGSAAIEQAGVWGGLIEENDRFVLIEYTAEEDVPSGGTAVGPEKWVLTLSDRGEDPLQSQSVPTLGSNLAVFYLAPLSDGSAQIAWDETLYVAIQENPIIFDNVAAPKRLVVTWVYDADATGNTVEDARESLFGYVEPALERFERTDDSTQELVDHQRITNAGLSYIDDGYAFWRRVLEEYFATQLEYGPSYDPSDPEFSDELGTREDSIFTQSLLGLFSTFGIPVFVAGIMVLMLLAAVLLALVVYVSGGSEHAAHALPFLGAVALAAVLVGLASAALFATITFLVFLLGAGTIIQKYATTT